MDDWPIILARGDGVGGEVVIRRRPSAAGHVYELIVNGTFLMDTAETSTEQLLAEALLKAHSRPARVLVGGLGLGFTIHRLLDDHRVEHVEVVEIEPLLVRWLRDAMVPGVDSVVSDPRVTVTIDDIRSVLPALTPSSYDGILLDIDNGPDFLVHDSNAEVYQSRLLDVAAHALRPGGLLGVWSAAPSDELVRTLERVVGQVDERVRTVERQGRQVEYHVYLALR